MMNSPILTIFDAIKTNNISYVINYIESKKDLEQYDINGWTPLNLAIECQSIEIAELIINAGANVNKLSESKSPLYLAVQTENEKLVKLLINYGANINNVNCLSSIISAAYNGNITIAKMLIDSGANINQTNQYNETPLSIACNQSYSGYSMIKFLLENGSNPSLKNCDGSFALHHACQHNHPEKHLIIPLLISYGIDINEPGSYGDTPLHMSVRYGIPSATKILLYLNANLYIKNNDGLTALDLATQKRHFECINLLQSFQNYQKLEKEISANQSSSKKKKI